MNKERILIIVDYLKCFPELYYKEDWESPCGTKYCFGGHAILMFGGTGIKSFNKSFSFSKIEPFNFFWKACSCLDLNVMEGNYILGRREIKHIEDYIINGVRNWGKQVSKEEFWGNNK